MSVPNNGLALPSGCVNGDYVDAGGGCTLSCKLGYSVSGAQPR